MNKTIAAAAPTLTICVAATLGFNAANASTDGVSPDQSMTHASLTYVVRFSDLDVSKFEGAKKLYARLRYAAKVVCKPLESAPHGVPTNTKPAGTKPSLMQLRVSIARSYRNTISRARRAVRAAP